MSSRDELKLRRVPSSIWQGESLPVIARFTPPEPFEGWAYAYVHRSTRLASLGGWTAGRQPVRATGPTILRFKLSLKSEIPPGQYTVKVRVQGQAGRHTASQTIRIEPAFRVLFFGNLTEDDLDHLAPDDAGRREALLVSVAETQASAAKDTLARHVRKYGVVLAVDNGGFQAMTSGITELQRRLERPATAPEIQGLFEKLMDEERAGSTIAAQFDLSPSILMCPEDGTLSALIICNREQELLDEEEPYRSYLPQQDRNIALAERVIRGELGDVIGTPYAVVHALDHDMAYEVGQRVAATDTITGIASGLGSFLRSRRWSTNYCLRGEQIAFNRNLPYSYHLVLQVTLGLIEGYKRVAGQAPRFHALGVGSPILMPLVILAAHDSPLLSFDSSVVERVAAGGKMFSPETGQELHLLQEVVLRGERWDCRCPACTHFLSQHPIDYAGVEAVLSGDYAARVAEIERIAARAKTRSWRARRLDKKAQAVKQIGALLAQGDRTAAQLTAEITGLGRDVIDSALQALLDVGLVVAGDDRFELSPAAGVQEAIDRLHVDLAAEAASIGQEAVSLYAERDQLEEEVDEFLLAEAAPLVPLAGLHGELELRQLARTTRIEHNQIMINRLIWQARERLDDLPSLLTWVEDRIRRYQAATTTVYARQVEECMRLVKSIKQL
jgi:hypothetical protein